MPMIPFLQKIMYADIRAQSKRSAEILKKIHTNVSFTKVISKRRKLEDHEIGEIIDVKRGVLTFEVEDERIEVKHEHVILRIKLKPPSHVQKYETLHKKKKMKSNGYER